MDIKIGTFNVLNLARPGQTFYDTDDPYSEDEYEHKVEWIAGQLRRMDADVVGFQEVFDEVALRDACGRSGLYAGGVVVAPGADGASGPKLGLATRLPVVEAAEPVSQFPPGLDGMVDGVALPVGKLSRPVVL